MCVSLMGYDAERDIPSLMRWSIGEIPFSLPRTRARIDPHTIISECVVSLVIPHLRHTIDIARSVVVVGVVVPHMTKRYVR